MNGSMPYREFLKELNGFADENYRNFHKKLLKDDKICVLGVKIPILRKLAAKYKDQADNILSYPDEFYEVKFIKLTAVSLLGYDEVVQRLDYCVGLIDNWALCDGFIPKAIAAHREEFLPVLMGYVNSGKEFAQRFVLTTLLHFYVDEWYLETIFGIVERCDTSRYYVKMAAAWLIAETLAKYFDRAKGFLLENSLDKATHNKSIQKACESFRLSNDEKNYLKGIKR